VTGPSVAVVTGGPSLATASALRSPLVRIVWIVAVILIVVGLAAWGTTCTGERPQPTGETIPAGDVSTTPPPTLAPTAG
jgi:hypothetical protein